MKPKFFYFIFLLPTLVLTDCNYKQVIDIGEEYYVYSENYPNNYNRPTDCFWASAATWSDNEIKLNCNVDIYPSNGCATDRLLVDINGDQDWNKALNYCGKGNFSVSSIGSHMNIYFHASGQNYPSKPGFSCKITSQKKIQCQCGWIRQNRIVGGVETLVNEYPWMAGILQLDMAAGERYTCGGSIISQSYVLTAAHCLLTIQVDNTGVLYGDHNLDTGSDTNSAGVVLAAAFIKHPYYDPQTSDYDIAIVRTKTSIPFSLKVGPVCLPYNVNDIVGQKATIMGWGTTYYTGSVSNVLLKADVDIISQDQCEAASGGKMFVTERQICTYSKDKDSCQFDSGGPVVWKDPQTSRHKLIGIISQGIECATDYPAVNTRVSQHLAWIQANAPSAYCYV